MWDYTNKVRDAFLHPKNVGEIQDPDGVGEVGSMACGDALRLTIKIDESEHIVDAKFKTFGCASAIASGSALTEMIIGKSLDEAGKITNKDIADYLGGLPTQKMHCSVLGREALEAAIHNYRTGETSEMIELEGRIVCKCFGVTEDEIVRVIQDNDLSSIEDVTNYCKAGGACGGCHDDIKDILARVRDEPAKITKKSEAPLSNIQKIKLIEETIEREIRPALRLDGGDLELLDVIDNRVLVSLRGNCSNCPMAGVTMKDVVQAKLREFVTPDIVVEEVSA